MSEWQPIETAPKNGEHFLAYTVCTFDEYDEDDCIIGRGVVEGNAVVAYYLFGGFVQFPFGGGIPTNLEYTHWMPLPEPPDAAEG